MTKRLMAVLATAILTGEWGRMAMAVEEPKFEVVEVEGDIEIRRYADTVVAETRVDGDFKAAGNEAFRRLAGYIFGGNDGGRKIEMTAPVAQVRNGGTKIPMTAPVSQEKLDEGWVVSFTMPSTFGLDTLPRPDDPRVMLRKVKGRRTAAIKFSGTWGPEKFEEKAAELRAALESRGLEADRTPVYARYDPPWTPWFLRRNEVLLYVAEPGVRGADQRGTAGTRRHPAFPAVRRER